jgi:hypothetical protein
MPAALQYVATRLQPRSRQRIKSLSRWLLLLFIAAILVGITYEKLGERRDRERFPQVGRSIDIGGRSLTSFVRVKVGLLSFWTLADLPPVTKTCCSKRKLLSLLEHAGLIAPVWAGATRVWSNKQAPLSQMVCMHCACCGCSSSVRPGRFIL